MGTTRYKILLVSYERDALSDFAAALENSGDVRLSWAESGRSALDMASKAQIDLVVSDEKLGDMTALELAHKLIYIDPMINCAAVSSLSHEDFHEAGEGLGLLAQLPPEPGAEQAEGLLQRLRELRNFSVE